MKDVKIKFLATLMGLGILASSVIPFVYWFRNPHLSHLEVFTEVWWLHFGGILVVFLTIALAGDDKKGRVPKMRNPPPPPEKYKYVETCYKYGGICKHDCPGQCRESC